MADRVAAEGDAAARYPFAFGVLDAAVWVLLTTWEAYADVPASHRLDQIGHDIAHLVRRPRTCTESTAP